MTKSWFLFTFDHATESVNINNNYNAYLFAATTTQSTPHGSQTLNSKP
jgi:pectin methylesterase-like acyl-CoA thioesterase